MGQYVTEPRQGEDLQILMNLKEKYKIVMLLHYVEGYKVKEISNMIHISEGTIKKRLQRGREMLKEIWREEDEL